LRGREGVPVGAGVVWMGSGDACVALGGGGRRAREQDEGDASVPTHHFHHPRPYGSEAAFEVTSYNTAPGGCQGRGIRSIAHAGIIHTPSLRLSAPGREVETHSIKIIQLQACLHLLVCSLDFLLRSHPTCDQKGLYESVCL
jgi:hypothetical protein